MQEWENKMLAGMSAHDRDIYLLEHEVRRMEEDIILSYLQQPAKAGKSAMIQGQAMLKACLANPDYKTGAELLANETSDTLEHFAKAGINGVLSMFEHKQWVSRNPSGAAELTHTGQEEARRRETNARTR